MRTLHDAVVGAELVSAWEFWRLPPGQIWWLIESKLDEAKPGSSMTDREKRELLDWVKQEKRKEAAARDDV